MVSIQRNIEIESEAWNALKTEADQRNKNVREFAGEILTYHIESKKAESATKPKAVILAAGQVNRLSPLINNLPVCMLEIKGKTLLQRLLDVFKECGITDISVVKGYKKSAIKYPNLKYYYNRNYKNNKMLESMFCAEAEMGGDFIVSYSDIWVDRSIIKKLLESNEDISVVIDTDWMKHYEDRHHHPIEEAEKAVIQGGKIIKIGKTVNPNVAHGEFIGLIKFSKNGAKVLVENYRKVKEKYGYDKPFHTAISLEKAYLTDMLQELIDRGHKVSNVDIKGDWAEIDTIEDFKRAQKIIK